MAEKSVSQDSLAIDKKQEYKGQKIRLAIIGCGGISQQHLRLLKTMPEIEVVAGVDIDPERLTLMEEKWGVTKLYKDWKTMLKEVKPDAVDVCTPNGVHAQPVIDGLNAGAHAFVEKPMAMNPAECKKMIDAAAKNKKKLAVGFQYRFHANTDFIVRARDEGMFGNIMFVKARALRRRGIPNWGVFGRKELQGGGPMIDIGVHVIEMAHYAMGSPKPVAASGFTWTFLGNKKSDVTSVWPNWDYKTYTVEDMAIGHVRFENDAILHIEASFAAHIEKDVWSFDIMGDKAGASWDPPMLFRDQAGTMVNTAPGWINNSNFDDLFGAKLRNWTSAIMHNTPLRAPGEAGMAVQKIIDGVYRSAIAGGKEVKID